MKELTLVEKMTRIVENGSDDAYIKFMKSLSYEEYGELVKQIEKDNERL